MKADGSSFRLCPAPERHHVRATNDDRIPALGQLEGRPVVGCKALRNLEWRSFDDEPTAGGEYHNLALHGLLIGINFHETDSYRAHRRFRLPGERRAHFTILCRA